MKSSSTTRLLTLLFFSVILVTAFSCKKILDKLIKDPYAVVEGCRIEKIVQWDGPTYDPRTYIFSYNSDGNPVSAISDMDATGAPNFYFRYDSKKRLTDYIELFTNGEYQSWKKFQYNHHGRVVSDSTWVFGTFGAQPDPASYYIRVSEYKYDIYGRITEVITDELQPTPTTYSNTYEYDGVGNLITWASYDSKININRTHKVWMFLNRNYSINHAPPALTYNANNLPTSFWGGGIFNFLGVSLEYSTIEYSCP